MHITIEHFDGARPQFNVNLASAPGKQPFLTVKGCRIVSGSKGEFVSWPATKNESTGKFWQHVYASEAFMAAVLEEARKTAPSQRQPARSGGDMSDVPF